LWTLDIGACVRVHVVDILTISLPRGPGDIDPLLAQVVMRLMGQLRTRIIYQAFVLQRLRSETSSSPVQLPTSESIFTFFNCLNTFIFMLYLLPLLCLGHYSINSLIVTAIFHHRYAYQQRLNSIAASERFNYNELQG
jgi:hypothetical protein